jgi:hypothetical protein
MQDDQDDDDLELAPELEMIEYEEEQQAIHDPGQLTEQLQAVEREIAQVGFFWKQVLRQMLCMLCRHFK